MDQLPSISRAIAQQIVPTLNLYHELHKKNETAIMSTLRKTFPFGPNPRHNLDIYYPATNPTGAGCPVLFYNYGGGFTRGDRVSQDYMTYRNLGHFFAEKFGFVTVIPDYRLVPEARFPSGGQDVEMALKWLIENNDEIGGPETRSLFMMGNSAGGVHMCTFLLHSDFAQTRDQITSKGEHCPLRLKAAVFLSMPASVHNPLPYRVPALKTYYGDEIERDCPLGLLEASNRGQTISDLLPGVEFLLMNGSLDPEDEILESNREFIGRWRSGKGSSKVNLEVHVMEGHNHISPPPSLGTNIPKEEAWGFKVAEFCNAAAKK